MPRYRVIHHATNEMTEVTAPTAQTACAMLGWTIGLCYVKELGNSPVDDGGRETCIDYAGYDDECDDS